MDEYLSFCFLPPFYVLEVPPLVCVQVEGRTQGNLVDAQRSAPEQGGEDRIQIWRSKRRTPCTVGDRRQDLVHKQRTDFR